jgi:hypothetical protein
MAPGASGHPVGEAHENPASRSSKRPDRDRIHRCGWKYRRGHCGPSFPQSCPRRAPAICNVLCGDLLSRMVHKPVALTPCSVLGRMVGELFFRSAPLRLGPWPNRPRASPQSRYIFHSERHSAGPSSRRSFFASQSPAPVTASSSPILPDAYRCSMPSPSP